MTWPLVKISDFCKTGSGGTPSRKVKEYYEGNIPWVKSGDLKEKEVIKATEVISELAIKKSSAKMVPKGAVLLAMYGATVGRMAMLGFDATTNQAVCFIIPDPEKGWPKYVYYALLNKVPEFLRNAVGGAQPNINQAMIKDTQIPLPPLDEQKRIAAILDKADGIRRKRQQAIKLADDFLRSVFLDIFGDDLQRNTNVVSFGDISILDAKMVDPREEEYLDLLHIGPDRIEKNTGKLLPALTAREERLISKKFLFNDQYILYSKIRPYLRKVAVPNFRAICSADMYPIKPVKGKVTREFLWSLLLSDYFDSYVSSLPARANIPKLNKTELAEFEFPLPDISQVEKFTLIIKKSFERSITIENSYKESEMLFNSLSQKAFAGKL